MIIDCKNKKTKTKMGYMCQNSMHTNNFYVIYAGCHIKLPMFITDAYSIINKYIKFPSIKIHFAIVDSFPHIRCISPPIKNPLFVKKFPQIFPFSFLFIPKWTPWTQNPNQQIYLIRYHLPLSQIMLRHRMICMPKIKLAPSDRIRKWEDPPPLPVSKKSHIFSLFGLRPFYHNSVTSHSWVFCAISASKSAIV